MCYVSDYFLPVQVWPYNLPGVLLGGAEDTARIFGSYTGFLSPPSLSTPCHAVSPDILTCMSWCSFPLFRVLQIFLNICLSVCVAYGLINSFLILLLRKILPILQGPVYKFSSLWNLLLLSWKSQPFCPLCIHGHYVLILVVTLIIVSLFSSGYREPRLGRCQRCLS